MPPPKPLAITWSVRQPPPALLVERLSERGVALSAAAQPGALAEIRTLTQRTAPRRARAQPGDRASERPWFAYAEGAIGAELARRAAAAGAYDVLAAGDAGALADRILTRLKELATATEPPPRAPGFVAEGPAGQELMAEIAHAARTSMPVLLTGETGTGKEVAARLLHAWSGRRHKRFVPINCGGIPNDLLESELFGHARGAFSGAVQSYEGQLAAAEGGTVLLDEVDDTPLHFQVKLLRVLEDRVVSRLGENVWRKVDFRILASSNCDLRALIAGGAFEPDLYERLAIITIRLPPLRERREDIPALALHFVERFYAEEPAARGRHGVFDVTAEALALLIAYPWPGNIRELRNVIYGALVRKRAGAALLVSDLPARLHDPSAAPGPGAGAPSDARALFSPEAVSQAIHDRSFNLRAAVEALEHAALTSALTAAGGNAVAAAELLGEVGRGSSRNPGATVRAMMRRLGVRR